jgi:hypothetical protein
LGTAIRAVPKSEVDAVPDQGLAETTMKT